MSAPRPRPVTATVRKPPPTGTYRAKKNVNLLSDSSGSTESLISCVDGCDSPADSQSESDFRPQLVDGQAEKTGDEANRNNSNGDEDSFSERIVSEKSAITSITQTDPSTPVTNSKRDSTVNIGPWEQWMIKKTESMKKLTDQKAQLEGMRKQQEKQQEQEKRERLQKAERIREEWLQQKNEEKARAERRQLLREKRKQREEQKKKQEIEEKAREKYDQWLEQKKKTDALRHALDIEQQKLKEMELKEKKEKSDAAFQAWLGKSFEKLKILPHSYAKCDGALTGYYDSGASPSPSYYNPLPWQPVALPKGQPKPKVKVRGKRRAPRNAWSIDN